MYCVHCGKSNPPEARFCYNCGKPIEGILAGVPPTAVSTPVPAPPTNSTWPGYVPPAPTGAYPYAPPAPTLPTYNVPNPNPYPINYPYPAHPVYAGNPYAYIPPLDSSQLERYHPLLKGAVGLPPEFYLNPTAYYSYVTPDNRVAIVKRGKFWQRVGAMLLDLIILFIPNFVLLLIYSSLTYNVAYRSSSQASVPSWWLYILFYLINFGYFWLGAVRGRTVGKRATRLRIIRLDGRNPDGLTAFLRQFCGYLLSASPGLLTLLVGILLSAILIPPGTYSSRTATAYSALFVLVGLPILFATTLLGFIWAGWDKKKQAWHDKLARTLVVEDVVWNEGQNFGLPRKQ